MVLPTPNPAPKLSYRPKELPPLTGISLRSINRAMATGALKAKKIGRITIIPAEALADFLSNAPAR